MSLNKAIILAMVCQVGVDPCINPELIHPAPVLHFNSPRPSIYSGHLSLCRKEGISWGRDFLTVEVLTKTGIAPFSQNDSYCL